MKGRFSIDLDDEEVIKSHLFGLTIECPVCELCIQCPMGGVRHLPLRDKLTWVNTLSHDERMYFYLEHIKCMMALEK